MKRRRLVRLTCTALGVLLLAPQAAAVAPTRSSGGVFERATGAVLIFDDGYDGITLVDLDRRVAVRRPIAGQRAGDQPYRLTRIGNSLIVGWDDVYAAPLDGGPSKLLGHATISVKAAEPDRVWLIDYPGSRIGSGVPVHRQVDLGGITHLEGTGTDDYPEIGIPGGLALQTTTGLQLWDAQTDQIVGHLGSTVSFAADTKDDLLAWCEGLCSSLHLTQIGGADAEVAAPTRGSFDAKTSRFSPDGRWVAAITMTPGPRGPDSSGELVVIRVTDGAVTRVKQSHVRQGWAVGWAPDSQQLFVNSNSYQRKRTRVSRYDVQSGELETVTLPFGGALNMVVNNRRDVRHLLEAPRGAKRTLKDENVCPPPTVQPSERTNACSFRF